jgi:hypothetical protein
MVEYSLLSLPAWNMPAAWVIAEYCLVKVWGVCCSICEYDVKNGILERTVHMYQILLQTEKKSYRNFETLKVILQCRQWEDMNHQAMKRNMS